MTRRIDKLITLQHPCHMVFHPFILCSSHHHGIKKKPFQDIAVPESESMKYMQQRMAVYLVLGIAIFSICLINLSIGTWHSRQFSTKAPSTFPQLHAENDTSTRSIRSVSQITSELQPLFLQEPYPRPPLDSIVQGKWNITGDPSWLLNFAITGFPKCGTSTLMFHLQNHPQVQIFGDERCDMSFNQQAKLIKDLYQDLPAGRQYTRGLKCPMDLENPALSTTNYNQFFPRTSFIVGIRHPILWFESFYNFRVHNQFQMPPAEQLVGKCQRGFFNLCTFRANFHIHLANLGKTPVSDRELDLVEPRYRRAVKPIRVAMANETTAATQLANHRKIFLYEVSQLSDPVYESQFRIDLQRFLGLTQPISTMIWFKPGRNHTSEHVKQKTAAKKIDICNDRYTSLRKILLEQAVNASKWIVEYFVASPDVVVSSPDLFVRELMPSWSKDPCWERTTTRQ